MFKILIISAILLISSIAGPVTLLDGNSTDYDDHMGWMMGPWLLGMPILMWIFAIAGLIIIVLFIILLIRLIERV